MLDRITVLNDPPVYDAGNLIINARDGGMYTTVMGRCRVEYDGRAKSNYGFGDRHVTLQPDGAVRVDTDEGVDPINWQNSGATYRARVTDDETLHIHVKQTSPTEYLDIEFTNVYFITATEMHDEAEFVLVGTESDMQDHIANDPTSISKAIGEQFIPLETEYKLDVGSVDIFGRTESDRAAIVELKRTHVGPDAVDQLLRYVVDFSEQESEDDVIGVLVAPSLTDSARKRMANNGFIHVPFTPAEAETDDDVAKNTKLSEYYTE